jgi:hypothetical protein
MLWLIPVAVFFGILAAPLIFPRMIRGTVLNGESSRFCIDIAAFRSTLPLALVFMLAATAREGEVHVLAPLAVAVIVAAIVGLYAHALHRRQS